MDIPGTEYYLHEQQEKKDARSQGIPNVLDGGRSLGKCMTEHAPESSNIQHKMPVYKTLPLFGTEEGSGCYIKASGKMNSVPKKLKLSENYKTIVFSAQYSAAHP